MKDATSLTGRVPNPWWFTTLAGPLSSPWKTDNGVMASNSAIIVEFFDYSKRGIRKPDEPGNYLMPRMNPRCQLLRKAQAETPTGWYKRQLRFPVSNKVQCFRCHRWAIRFPQDKHCPVCNGTGYLWAPKYVRLSNGFPYQGSILRALSYLDGIEVSTSFRYTSPSDGSEQNPLAFRWSGGFGILAPCDKKSIALSKLPLARVIR